MHCVPNLYDFLSSVEYKRGCLELELELELESALFAKCVQTHEEFVVVFKKRFLRSGF